LGVGFFSRRQRAADARLLLGIGRPGEFTLEGKNILVVGCLQLYLPVQKRSVIAHARAVFIAEFLLHRFLLLFDEFALLIGHRGRIVLQAGLRRLQRTEALKGGLSRFQLGAQRRFKVLQLGIGDVRSELVVEQLQLVLLHLGQ